MKLPHSGAYLWTDSFDFTLTKNSLNLCGSEIGEGKFVSLIEAIATKDQVLNLNNRVELEFGTTLSTDPLYASFGISALRVYIRWWVKMLIMIELIKVKVIEWIHCKWFIKYKEVIMIILT